jgi:hypothetical protein
LRVSDDLLFKELDLFDIPGVVGEETAVECVHLGPVLGDGVGPILPIKVVHCLVTRVQKKCKESGLVLIVAADGLGELAAEIAEPLGDVR